jgi:hypothetical protein
MGNGVGMFFKVITKIITLFILMGSLGFLSQGNAQCPLPTSAELLTEELQLQDEFSPEVDDEYHQPPSINILAPYSILRIQQNDFLSPDVMRIVMATLEEQPRDPNFINIDEIFTYRSMFQASGYRREICADRMSQREVDEYDGRAQVNRVEAEDRRFSQKILEGFIQGTVEPSVGGIVGGDPRVIIGFNYNPSQGTFEEIIRGSVNLGGNGGMLSEAELRRQFVNVMNMHIPSAHRRRLGSLRRITTVVEGGHSIATEIEFANITLTKAHGSQAFRGTLDDGTDIRIYCGAERH